MSDADILVAPAAVWPTGAVVVNGEGRSRVANPKMDSMASTIVPFC